MTQEVNIKDLIEHFGGNCLFGGALIQFNESSFKEMYLQIYDAGMLIEREACAKLCDEQADDGSEGEWDTVCHFLAKKIRARGEE